MKDLLQIQFFSVLRLLFAAYLFFSWVPRKILPQEYTWNSLDRALFNIIHMVAISTLIFPLFISLHIFGFPFVLLFFITVRLIFLRFWYKKPLLTYLRHDVYYPLIIGILRILEEPHTWYSSEKKRISRKYLRLKADISTPRVIKWITCVIILSYAFYIRFSGALSTMLASVSDMYPFYYWNDILKINKLCDKVVGSPYPWGAPVLIHAVDLFARMNTVLLYNTFPILILSFTFFTLFYCANTLLYGNGPSGSAPWITIILFGIVIPSPLAQLFFGTVFQTSSPEIIHLPLISLYGGLPKITDAISEGYPFLFYIRGRSTLPYEMAAGFFLINLYFLHKAFETRRTSYIVLYAETLAIIFSIHSAIALPLLFPSILVLLSALCMFKTDRKTILRGLLAISAALIIGNAWMVQFFIYGIPGDVGAAAPIVDKILHTKRAQADAAREAFSSIQLVSPTGLLCVFMLSSCSLFLYGLICKDRQKRGSLVFVSIIATGILFLYFEINMGLPRLVDHSRLQPFLAISYSLVTAFGYRIIIEQILLESIFRKRAFIISFPMVTVLALATIFVTPRWIGTDEYQRFTPKMELAETPYFLFKIEEAFQPMTYTVVSYVESLSQVYSLGYHMNTHELITTYDPRNRELIIPTEYIFIFTENTRVLYKQRDDYWYRWRDGIMIKLKDWIALYSRNHGNIKLWASTENLQVYLIDNRPFMAAIAKKRKGIMEPAP